MVFETATAVKEQVSTGAERMMHLVGYDASVVDKAMDFATKNPVSKKVLEVADLSSDSSDDSDSSSDSDDDGKNNF